MKTGLALLGLLLACGCGGDDPPAPPRDEARTPSVDGHARPELILARVAEGWRCEVRAAPAGGDAVRSIEVHDGAGARLGRVEGAGPLVFGLARPPALLRTRVVWDSGHEREHETRP